MKIESNKLYIFLAIILAIILILNLLLCIVMPFLLIIEIIIAFCEYLTVKKIKKINNQKNKKEIMENNLLVNGYRKIYDGLFIKEDKKLLNILGKDYQFKQIINCELIQNNKSLNSSYERTEGKIKDNGKIKSKTSSLSSTFDYCNELYLNITVDDFTNPNIKLNIKDIGTLSTTGKKYKKTIEKANEILSLFKIIIAKNN